MGTSKKTDSNKQDERIKAFHETATGFIGETPILGVVTLRNGDLYLVSWDNEERWPGCTFLCNIRSREDKGFSTDDEIPF